MMKTFPNKQNLLYKSGSSESFEFVEISDDKTRSNSAFEFAPDVLDNAADDDDVNYVDTSFIAINNDVFETFFDNEGRLVQPSKLREALFHGGCEPDVRPNVWSFIFGLYPASSTKQERNTLKLSNHFKYHALKNRCFELLRKKDFGKINEEIENFPLPSTLHEPEYPSTEIPVNQYFLDNCKTEAMVYAKSQSVDLQSVGDWYKVIDKDIPRTDIDHPYFQGIGDQCLIEMRNILATFGLFHPKIGYVQGMNDILTRFMIVLESEADAYWCFAAYMERMENDFDEMGMLEKIDHVRCLLEFLEPSLFSHFRACSVPDLLFCHRWLLVSFKREFGYEESIRYFEIAHSQHIELDSYVAWSMHENRPKMEANREGDGTSSCGNLPTINYTFDIFVCVSVIMLKRLEFLGCTDASEVFHVACNVPGTLDLEEVCNKAYTLFLKYCRKCTADHNAKEEKNNNFDIPSLVKSFQSFSLNGKKLFHIFISNKSSARGLINAL